MKLYKVLNKDLTSPYQRFQFELGKKYICDDFDMTSKQCSTGFYAVDFNGLVYAINKDGKKHSVFEVEVGGRFKEFNQFKRRYEEITILRELTDDEIKTGLLACEESEGYKVYEACFPVNPFSVEPIPLEDAKKLLQEWMKVRDSVRASVRASLGDSVGQRVRVSVWDSVWDSVGLAVGDSVRVSVGRSVGRSVGASPWDSVGRSVRVSVWDSVWAYISRLFPNVQFDLDFSPCVELWKGGFVPSFDGETWRLHAAKGIAFASKNIV